ncbi:MAG: polyprenyl synthetase family protein [Lachnospiraceae bacterium]|nr:polyprenyl synthetase family protein [Lachnospiraceae bacterium]
MSFETKMQSLTKETEALLERYLPAEAGLQSKVMKAMNYSVRAGGKRLRPILMLLTYRMFGGDSEVIGPFMCAMEMIHTYSLVHDDLPAMDNDELRRGKPTTHVAYGEGIAILAGDALLNYSMETVVTAFSLAPQEVNRIAASIALLYRKSGIHGMIGGQTVDIETDLTGDVSREQIDFIYRLKTGALIEASMMIGAILAGASDEEVAIISEIAQKVGLAFQIRDDILDCTSTPEELGKPIGSDEKNQKATYVSFEGVKKSEEHIEALSKDAIEKLRSLQRESLLLEELIQSLIDRKK